MFIIISGVADPLQLTGFVKAMKTCQAAIKAVLEAIKLEEKLSFPVLK